MASLMHYDPTLAPRQMRYEPALAPRAVPSPRELHEVWQHNLDQEFALLLTAVKRAGGPDAILALDMEFPGFPVEDPQFSSPKAHYQALCHNVDQLWPIQLGVAVVGPDGVHRGVWTFNLHFDADVDMHTEESLTFLRRAGVDFPRHRLEGINSLEFGMRLSNSSLFGAHGRAPCWLTFSGSYDWGYLLKLLTMGRPLPGSPSTFDKVLSLYCPRRRELRDLLPSGSLEMLGKRHGVKRWGAAHTAGSDALLTLELFMILGGEKLLPAAALDTEPLFDKRGLWTGNESAWGQKNNASGWGQNLDEWGDPDQWYSNDILGWDKMSGGGFQVNAETWENSTWVSQSPNNNGWFSPNMLPSSSWYNAPQTNYSQSFFASL